MIDKQLLTQTVEQAIENTEAVHLATGDPEFNWKCSQEAKNQDLLVSFDPGQDLGMYDTKKLVDVIENTTILFGNHHEIERILDALEVDLTALTQIEFSQEYLHSSDFLLLSILQDTKIQTLILRSAPRNL